MRGGNTLSATLCARWCVSKDEPLFLFSFSPPGSHQQNRFCRAGVRPSMHAFAVHLLTRRGAKRRGFISVCQRWVLKATRLFV